MLGDQSVGGTQMSLIVRFPVTLGAPGLKEGSPVTLGGQRIGQVQLVRFFPEQNKDGGSPTPYAVDVMVTVPTAVTLTNQAIFALERPLIGNISSINITSAGVDPSVHENHNQRTDIPQDGPDERALRDGDIVAGGVAPPAFLAQAGITSKDIGSIRASIAAFEKSITNINELITNASPEIKATIADAQSLTASLRERFTPWAGSVDNTLKNVETASAQVGPILDDAKAITSDTRGLITSAQSIVDENRPSIESALRSIESAAGKLDGKTLDELSAAFTKGQDAIDALAAAIGRVDAVITAEVPNARRIIANLRLMSDNLKLTAVEVRSQPWRALYQPTNKELSTQSLYDATRAYSQASSDLRAASDSLTSLIELGKDTPETREATAILTRSGLKYKEAEQALLDELIRVQGGK